MGPPSGVPHGVPLTGVRQDVLRRREPQGGPQWISSKRGRPLVVPQGDPRTGFPTGVPQWRVPQRGLPMGIPYGESAKGGPPRGSLKKGAPRMGVPHTRGAPQGWFPRRVHQKWIIKGRPPGGPRRGVCQVLVPKGSSRGGPLRGLRRIFFQVGSHRGVSEGGPPNGDPSGTPSGVPEGGSTRGAHQGDPPVVFSKWGHLWCYPMGVLQGRSPKEGPTGVSPKGTFSISQVH